MRYKVGDRARIKPYTPSPTTHHFEVGSIVTIIQDHGDHYQAEGWNSKDFRGRPGCIDRWWLNDSHLEDLAEGGAPLTTPAEVFDTAISQLRASGNTATAEALDKVKGAFAPVKED